MGFTMFVYFHMVNYELKHGIFESRCWVFLHLIKWLLCKVFWKGQPVKSDMKSFLGETNLLQSL